ncbi:MAG: hypothetical protein OEN56_07870 [Gemmatimonadota bacterium]|nr:hypothetical protein [Gemmatimonadota bacterium]
MTRGRPLASCLVTAATAISACGGGPTDPGSTGGELLRGSEGVDYLGGRPFSFSPEGRWMVFSTRPPGEEGFLEAYTIPKLETYVRYDTRTLEGTKVEVSEELRDSLGPDASMLFDGGCWIPVDGGWRVVLRDAFSRALGFDPEAPGPEWRTVEVDRSTLAERCPFEDPLTGGSVTLGRFRVDGGNSKHITIVDSRAPDRVLASHRTRAPGRTLLLGEARPSPDGRRLAYTVSPNFGTFVGRARMYVVSVEESGGAPQALASSVFALRWADAGEGLYAHVRAGGVDAIYRWRIEP